MVIITSDHGESFGENGIFGHSSKMYDPVMRIPLILHAPRLPLPPSLSQKPASLTDLMPTILAIANLPAPAVTNGFNLLSAWDETKPSTSGSHEVRYGEPQVGKHGTLSIVTRSPRRKTLASREGENFAINLETDPHEERPSVEAHEWAAAATDLEAYEKILRETRNALRLQNTAPADARSLDDATRQRLESLGYLTND